MPNKILLSVIESPTHTDFSRLYADLGFDHLKVNSMRKALAYVKTSKPDFVVAEFFYGYGNNYAGVNLSNLDVFLYALEKYAPDTKVIAMTQRSELKHAERLNEITPFYAIVAQPVRPNQLHKLLNVE